MKVQDFADMLPHCPARMGTGRMSDPKCGKLITSHDLVQSVKRGDIITLHPCGHSFIETSQGIKLL